MVVESVDAIRVVVWDSVKDSSLVRSKTGNKSVRILIFISNIFGTHGIVKQGFWVTVSVSRHQQNQISIHQ